MDPATVELSLSEIDATCRKAARGAGYPWGLAQEAGRAAADLAAAGVDGPAALLVVLRALDAGGGDPSSHAPLPGPGAWRAAGGTDAWLCPVRAGAALSDRAHRIAVGDIVTLKRTLAPVLIAPMLERARRALGCGAELDGIDASGLPVGHAPATVRIRFVAERAGDPSGSGDAASGVCPTRGTRLPRDGRLRLASATVAALEAFAHRTYVPASEASRAGAGGAADDG